jgi:hypothetical protein
MSACKSTFQVKENIVTKKEDDNDKKLPTVPGSRNVFEAVGDAMARGGAIIGSLLKFSKGDWLAGPDGEEIAAGTELVAVVPGTLDGWVRWEDNRPVEQIMGLLVEGFVPPVRSTLGHDDKSVWEIDAAGKPRDPWQPTIYMPMSSLNAEKVFTFTTSSDGGRRHAVGPLCKEYGGRIRQHPDELPIVKLHQGSYLHSDRSIGRIKYPELPASRWVKADKYLAAVADVAGRPLKLLENT